MEPIEKIKVLGYKVLDEVESNDEINLSDIEIRHKIRFPVDYVSLFKNLGYFRFVSPVMARSISEIRSISVNNNLVPVGQFLTWRKNDFSIDAILSYSEQLPSNFIPFADGESGDFIGFNFININAYNIGYWHHEGFIHQDNHVIANNFKDFIDSLVIHEIVPNNDDMAKVRHIGPSSKMIELLKKTGKWKGD